MLLKHGWLASLTKPTTISEEDEEMCENMENLEIESGGIPGHMGENSYDKEVADWVKYALEKKSGKMGVAAKPALHAAPLDSISPAASPAGMAESVTC
jgi:mitogen-activated protein kinase kinase